MHIRAYAASLVGALSILSVAPAIASADALTVSCSGTPAAASVTWVASPSGGVAPYALLWGNGSTSSSQTVAATPGSYSMNIQVTDASSTVATSTCSASVAWPVPTIATFVATPASIVVGQSSVLSWNVSNASSTTVSGLGVVTGTAATVSPAVTTTYTLSAVNPSGTTTATATVYVTATSTPGSGSIAAQIQALLQQIRALQAQIIALMQARAGSGGVPTTTPPIVTPGDDRGCSEETHELHGLGHSIIGALFRGGCTTASATSTAAGGTAWSHVETHVSGNSKVRYYYGKDD